jgi:hypothetical protein
MRRTLAVCLRMCIIYNIHTIIDVCWSAHGLTGADTDDLRHQRLVTLVTSGTHL